ncbi:MAG: prepilin peptidase [bacterium]
MIYLLFIIGTLFGSFFLVVGTRSLAGEDYIVKRSHCDYCMTELKWFNLIPVISFLLQGCKCNYCKKKLNYMYPLTEIATGLLFAFSYYTYGSGYELIISLILSSLLVLICITDFKEMIILDTPLIVSIILIILCMLYFNSITYLLTQILSGLFMFCFFLLIKKVGDHAYKRESMGGGDIKFAFIIGLVLGVEVALYAVILSAFLALPTSVACVMITNNKEVPYGPFLAGALLLLYLNLDKIPLLF